MTTKLPTIVNSGEFGARSDGATPIGNRRATSDNAPNFSSIDYKLSYVASLLDQAAKFIKSGNIVAFPTETVYGLGADASNEQACQKIFKVKKRPSINPLIVHVATMSQAKTIGEFNADALKLSEVFWPGPLSIVVPLKSEANIAKSLLAGLTTVALRIPSHNIALELIRKSGTSIAAPSANPSGYISATTLDHVKEHFSGEKDVFILEDNSSDYKCQYGIESTIVDSTTNNLTILRDGFITLEALEKVLGKKICPSMSFMHSCHPTSVRGLDSRLRGNDTKDCGNGNDIKEPMDNIKGFRDDTKVSTSFMQIKAPGMMNKHYSPKVKMRLNAESLEANEVGLNFANSKLEGNFSLNLSLTGDLIIAASNLFASLRILDNYAELNGLAIAVASIPEIGIGVAINDRLKRAAIK
nr:L-threonylcarbamoyladenylate synthase [Rickettsia endosymbiont of Oedothorax gibbosus]